MENAGLSVNIYEGLVENKIKAFEGDVKWLQISFLGFLLLLLLTCNAWILNMPRGK